MKKFIVLFVLGLLLVGCSNNDEVEETDEEIAKRVVKILVSELSPYHPVFYTYKEDEKYVVIRAKAYCKSLDDRIADLLWVKDAGDKWYGYHCIVKSKKEIKEKGIKDIPEYNNDDEF